MRQPATSPHNITSIYRYIYCQSIIKRRDVCIILTKQKPSSVHLNHSLTALTSTLSRSFLGTTSMDDSFTFSLEEKLEKMMQQQEQIKAGEEIRPKKKRGFLKTSFLLLHHSLHNLSSTPTAVYHLAGRLSCGALISLAHVIFIQSSVYIYFFVFLPH